MIWGCPSEDVVELYVMNRLPDSDVPGVEEHVLICSVCQEKCEVVREEIQHLRNTLSLDS